MPSNVTPLDPAWIMPKESKKVEENVIRQKKQEFKAPPDVSDMVEAANKRLMGKWEPNELRCGRAVFFGFDKTEDELKEVARILSNARWQITFSFEKRGIIMSVKPPAPEKQKSNGRSQRGYL